MRKLLVILLLATSAFAQQQVQPVAGVLTLNLVPGTSSFKVILSVNVTSVVIQNPTPGTIISVIFTENATGGFTVAFGGNIANPCTVATTANTTTTCQFQYDATSNTWNGIGGGGGNPDPPVSQNYTLTATGAQAAVNLTAAPIDTHTISWRLSGITSFVNDSFQYANGDLHTSNTNWVYQSGTFTVSANAAYGSSASSFATRSDGPSAQATEYAQATMVETAGGATQNGGPCVRMSLVAQTAYCIQASNSAVVLLLWNAGSSSALFTSNLGASNGDVLRITASGTTISLYRNGVLLGSATDATIATGAVGIFNNGNATANGVSNFQGGLLPTCSVALDTSQDGTNWVVGGAIAAQNCSFAYPGSAQSPNVTANFVRVNVISLANASSLSVIYSGRLAPSLPATGNASVSNGQWVQAGEVVWTQATSQLSATPSITTNIRLVAANGTVSYITNTVGCLLGPPGGVGFATVIPNSGFINAVSSQINGGNFPNGSIYLQAFIFPAIPATGSTTSCAPAYTSFAQESAPLYASPTGSNFMAGFTGTTSINFPPWSQPGYTTTLVPATPAAGAELTFTFTGTVRACVQGVSFTLAAGSTNVNPTVVLTINGSKVAYTAVTAQTSATTQNYSFSPGAAAEAVTAGATIFHIVPFNNGQLVCTNAGLSTLTLATVTTGLNGTTAYTNPSILVQLQQDNN